MDNCGDCGGGVLDGYRRDNCGNYTCKNCFEHLPSKAPIVTKHKCPHRNGNWVVLNQYA